MLIPTRRPRPDKESTSIGPPTIGERLATRRAASLVGCLEEVSDPGAADLRRGGAARASGSATPPGAAAPPQAPCVILGAVRKIMIRLSKAESLSADAATIEARGGMPSDSVEDPVGRLVRMIGRGAPLLGPSHAPLISMRPTLAVSAERARASAARNEFALARESLPSSPPLLWWRGLGRLDHTRRRSAAAPTARCRAG